MMFRSSRGLSWIVSSAWRRSPQSWLTYITLEDTSISLAARLLRAELDRQLVREDLYENSAEEIRLRPFLREPSETGNTLARTDERRSSGAFDSMVCGFGALGALARRLRGRRGRRGRRRAESGSRGGLHRICAE